MINIEISNRIKQVQQGLSKLNLDFYISTDPNEIYYLTNFTFFIHERILMLIIPANGKLKCVTAKIEELNFKRNSIGDIEIITYKEFPATSGNRWSDIVNEVVGVDAQCGVCPEFPISLYNQLTFKASVCGVVEKIRMIKSLFEINQIKYTSAIISDAHKKLLNLIPDKLTIAEMYAQISKYCMQRIFTDIPDLKLMTTSIDSIIVPDIYSDVPHDADNALHKITSNGPHTTIITAKINGYAAEVERTFFVNKVPEGHIRYFNDMLEARDLAFNLLKPGAIMSDIDKGVNDFLKKRGHEHHLLHRTGHSFGVTNHEAPFLAEGYEEVVMPNMLFSIEPGIYIPDVGGFRFSDTVLVTDTGNTCLTQAPTTLDDLLIKNIF
jgi:Xaa-Pro dipeptidase